MAIARVLLFRLASWLAYGALTPLYEWVAQLYSDGEWHTWRRQGLAAVQEAVRGTAAGRRPRVLEVGCGTGALLVELAQLPCTVLGVDRSSPMLAAARRRSAGRVALLQGRAEALPLPAGSVDAVVLTFPTEYAYAAATWQEFARVLIPGGQVIWIDAGELRDPGWLVRTLQTLLPGAELASLMDGIIPRLNELGFTAEWRVVELPRSRVHVLRARSAGST